MATQRASRARGWRRSAVSVLLSATILAATAVPVSSGERDFPDPLEPIPLDEVSGNFDISDGDYTGTMGLNGTFWLSTDGVFVLWAGEGIGPAQFTVVDGELIGTWSGSGFASVSSSGAISLSGQNTWSMSGTLDGSNPYFLSGSGQGYSEATVFGSTSSSDYPIDLKTWPLNRVVQVCDQVLAAWDRTIDDAFAGLPQEFSYSIPTYIAVMSTNSLSGLESRLEDLVESGLEIQGGLSRDPLFIIADLASLLLEAEQLLGDIATHPDNCPPGPSFARLITQIVGDVFNTFLNKWANEESEVFQMLALRRFVEVALRAGVIGAGAADPAAGEYLQAKAGQLLQQQFDAIVSQDPMSLSQLAEVAITATMLGYTFENGISGSDICIVMGTC